MYRTILQRGVNRMVSLSIHHLKKINMFFPPTTIRFPVTEERIVSRIIFDPENDIVITL